MMIYQINPHSINRIFLCPFGDHLWFAIASGIIGCGVIAHAIGDQLDQCRLVFIPCPIGIFYHGFINGARLAYALRHPDFAAAIRQRASQATILAAAVAMEHGASHPAEGKPL